MTVAEGMSRLSSNAVAIWSLAAVVIASEQASHFRSPLPWFECPCREPLWREFTDNQYPRPALVSLSVQFPYPEDAFNQTLQVNETHDIAEVMQSGVLVLVRSSTRSLTIMAGPPYLEHR